MLESFANPARRSTQFTVAAETARLAAMRAWVRRRSRSAMTASALEALMRLRLDVRSHPGFGVDLLNGELRWFVNSGFVLSFGVGLDAPLTAIPPLLSYRRATGREFDPAEQLLG